MCVAVFQAGGNVRKVFEEGIKMAWEEEDIMGDFPPCLQRSKCTHRMFFEVPKQRPCVIWNIQGSEVGHGGKKVWWLTKDTVADVVLGGLRLALRRGLCSFLALIPSKLNCEVSEDGKDNGSTHFPPTARWCQSQGRPGYRCTISLHSSSWLHPISSY